MKSWRVVRDDGDRVKQVIVEDHYLQRWPDARSLPFAYRLIPTLEGLGHCAEDGRPFGVVVFKKPQHQQQRGLFGYSGLPTSWQVLDLARVWVHPTLQRKREDGHAACTFSQMVGLAIRRVQQDWLIHHPPRYPELPYHIEVIVSYCDLQHHDGTAYRASGFRWIGYTTDRKKEVYARNLLPPLKRWRMPGDVQIPLPGFGAPLKYD